MGRKNEVSFGLLKYRMSFAFIDTNKEVKSSYYLIYIHSNEQLILVENDAKFTKLSIADSKNYSLYYLAKLEEGCSGDYGRQISTHQSYNKKNY